ncbi:DNA-directed RNA polymerase subunit Rpb7 [Paramuricea clavata]|uniref:DNA-directed RNA polymerase subunit Rpb7 n=1 Tax=Paramuricea clavata TaxID=317549 RepID=A0A7D9DE53_PARCT|nr:DNA-directed RNA polymerase subunit Rpb7 [Paramuricea clavata]
MSTESKMSKEVYDAVLLTAGAVGISIASKKILKEPLGAGYLFKMFDKNGYAEEAKATTTTRTTILRRRLHTIGLASMNGIKLRDPPEDIRTQKIVNVLEDRLYGKETVEGKCYGNYGVVTKVHGIKKLSGGGIQAEDIRAAAYFTVHFTCTLCRLEEGAIVERKVRRINGRIIVIKNGPVTILATTDKCMTAGEDCKVKVLSVTLIGGEPTITTTGKIIN